MDYERMERTMAFILDQMADITVKQAKTDDQLADLTVKQAKIDDQLAILSADAVTADVEWARLRAEIREVKEVAIAHNQAINRLLKAQEESMKLHEQHRVSFAEVGQRIDDLRKIVETQVRAGHNGKPE